MRSTSRLYKEKFQGSSQSSEVERAELKESSFDGVLVEDWVEFWRWKSKAIEKKWQKRN
jgi:hypothetical protein